MRSAGVALMSSFAAGVQSAAGKAVAAARAAVAKIAAILPGSPAEEGPLSGQGYVRIRGQHFSQDLAAGISDQANLIRRATLDIAGMMSMPMPKAVKFTTPAAVRPAPSSGGMDMDRLVAALANRPASAPTIQITNHYPVAEKESVVVNRALQMSAALGVLG